MLSLHWWGRRRVLSVIGRSRASVGGVGVLIQKTHSAKSLFTFGTRILLRLEMGLKMRPQIGLIGERSRAELTLKRLLAGVSSHVTLQQPRPRKTLAAKLAFAWQSVSPDVHLQRAQSVVMLPAISAREFLLDLIRTVQLLMFGVTGLSGKGLFALSTVIGFILGTGPPIVAAVVVVITVSGGRSRGRGRARGGRNLIFGLECWMLECGRGGGRWIRR